MNSPSDEIKWLEPTYKPTDNDVFVGRGKQCYNHFGNRRLVEIVKSHLGTYSAEESTKKSRSELINNVVDEIQEGSPEGGFIKYDGESKQWFLVTERVAREKVSQTFRDALNDRYRSSATSKILKRRKERISKKRHNDGHERTAVSEPSSPTVLFEHRARVDSLLQAAQNQYRPQSVPTTTDLPGSSLAGLLSMPRHRSYSYLETLAAANSSLPRQISYESATEASASPLARQTSRASLMDTSPLPLHHRSVSDAGAGCLPPPPLAHKSTLQRLRALQASRELDRKAEEYMLLSSIFKNSL